MAFDFGLLAQGVESVITFFLMGCLGFWLAKLGWFNKESKNLITRLVTQITLPVYLLWNINSFMTKEQLASLAYGLPLPVAAMLLTVAVGSLLVRLLKVPPTRRGAFCAIISFSNTVYIGIPVNQALFGDASLPFALLYYFANTTLFWTMGTYLMASDNPSMQTRILSLGTLKKIMTPPMYGFLGGMVLLLLDLRLPTVLSNTARYLGNLTTPLVIISIGITLHDLGLARLRFNREMWAIVLSRFLVSPVLLILLMLWTPLPDLMGKVFIIQASLPAMSTVPMMAAFYRTETEFATVAVSATTLLSIVTIPFYMMLASTLQ